MAQKERVLKRLLSQMNEGDQIPTPGLRLKGAEVEFLTKYQDGRLLAVYKNPKYNPDKKGSKEKPYRAFYVDELPTLQVVGLVKDILKSLEETPETKTDEE